MRRISLGWIAVTFLVAAGGLSFAAAVAGVVPIEGEWFEQATLFVGALFGGLVAARTSPPTRRLEPIAGGVLLAAGMMAIVWVVTSSALGSSSLQVELSFQVGLLAGLGAVVGVLAGKRLGRPRRPASHLRWLGLSALIHLGLLGVLMTSLILANRGLHFESWSAGASLVALFPLVFAAGFITQAAAPEDMYGICGGGGALGLMLLSLIGIAAEGAWLTLPLALLGAALGGLVLTLFGALGARLGWAVAQRFGRPEPEGDLPSARAR